MKKSVVLSALFFLLVALAVLAPIAPLYQPVPARDQGVYLYVGQQILEGKIPYRDVWDHKGPLVYYIDALGLWITGSTWGVWFLEIIFLFLAALASFLALQIVFDPAIAFASTILWMVSLPQVLDHGNTVEEYSLVFQFAAIYFFLRSEKNRLFDNRPSRPFFYHREHTLALAGSAREVHGENPPKNSVISVRSVVKQVFTLLKSSIKGYWNEITIGGMAALAFCLRPNNIGVHAAIGLVLIFGVVFSPKERIHSLRRVIAAAAGSTVIFGVVAFYFAVHKSLGDLFDAMFIFNYYYSKLETISWLAFPKGLNSLTFLVTLGMAGFIGLISHLYGYWKQKADAIKIHFALFTLVVIPIQLYLSLLSGRRYLHYYIAWLPFLALLAGFLISSIRQLAEKYFPDLSRKNILNVLISGVMVVAFGLKPVMDRMPTLMDLVNTIGTAHSLPEPDPASVEQGVYADYILTHTKSGDYVLIWGNASAYNFLTKRQAPSRFVYTYAFGVPYYVSQEMADGLIKDIAEKKPMIIDATAKDKTIAGIDSGAWKDIPTTQGVIRFIEENYEHVDTVGPSRFRIWVYKER
jgi:hypothetical protein